MTVTSFREGEHVHITATDECGFVVFVGEDDTAGNYCIVLDRCPTLGLYLAPLLEHGVEHQCAACRRVCTTDQLVRGPLVVPDGAAGCLFGEEHSRSLRSL